MPESPLHDRALRSALVIGLPLAIGALILFAWIAESVDEGDTLRFDEYVRTVIHGQATPALTSAMRLFSLAGSPTAMVVLSIAAFVILWRTGWVRAAWLLGITVIGAALLNEVLKLSFRRTRPTPYFQYPEPPSYSFPSGHALFSFCFFGMLASLLAARLQSAMLRAVIWMAAIVAVVMIGFSRIYLGVHYPTDVLGGYIAALIWVTAVTFGDRWHRSRRDRQ